MMARHIEQEAYQIFLEAGAIRRGHFVLTSGRHAETYLNKKAIYQFPSFTSRLAGMLAGKLAHIYAEAVVGPESGGIILAEHMARHLSSQTGRDVFHAPAHKTADDGFEIRSPWRELVSGMRVLAVDDIVTTGGSLKKTVEAVDKAGGSVVAVGALWKRGEVALPDIDTAGNILLFDALISRPIESWEPPCPLCERGVPSNLIPGR